MKFLNFLLFFVPKIYIFQIFLIENPKKFKDRKQNKERFYFLLFSQISVNSIYKDIYVHTREKDHAQRISILYPVVFHLDL